MSRPGTGPSGTIDLQKQACSFPSLMTIQFKTIDTFVLLSSQPKLAHEPVFLLQLQLVIFLIIIYS